MAPRNSAEPTQRRTRSSSRPASYSDISEDETGKTQTRGQRKRPHDEVTEDESEMLPVSARKGSKTRKSNPPSSRSTSATPRKPKSTPKPVSVKKQKKMKEEEQAKITLQATQKLLASQNDDEEDQEQTSKPRNTKPVVPLLSHLQSLAPSKTGGNQEDGEEEDKVEGEGEENKDEDDDEGDVDDDEDDEAGGDVQDVDMDEDGASETSETTSSHRKDAKIVTLKRSKASKGGRRGKGKGKGKAPLQSRKGEEGDDADDDDDGDDGNDDEEEESRPRQRGPKHVKSDFDEDSLAIAEKARNLIRKKIVLEDALPLDNTDFIREVLRKYTSEAEAKHLDSLPRRKRQHLIEWIGYVISAIRNKVKTAASTATPNAYNLVGTSKPSVVQRKVSWLLEGSHFHYAEINMTHKEFTYNRQTPYSHPVIADIIRSTFFEGASERTVRGIFNTMMQTRTIPTPLLALVVTTIQHSLEEYTTGRKLAKEFRASWARMTLQAKPSLLAALDNQVDTSNEFVGVDFSALKAQVPSSNQRHSSTAPPQNPSVKSEEDVPKLESEEVDMTSPSKESEEVTDAMSTPTQASGVLEEGVGEEGSAEVSAP
ncbi:hypothetical protein ONZ45_g17437 [Pleurotus djamor]|nr:hypothetical protein ONZ45_g17437 [Pleurotus djamor]